MKHVAYITSFLVLSFVCPVWATWDKGFDFRETAGAETDPADCTYVLASDTSPTTRNGATFQWVSGTPDSRDRNIGNDARLEGMNFVSNALGVFATWQLTLPATGDYDIYLAAGDAASVQGIHLQMQDNTTPFVTFSGITTGGANIFVDASGAVRTAAQWLADSARGGTKVTHTFTSTTLRIVIGSGTDVGNASTIAHLFVSQVSAGPPPSISRRSPVLFQ